MKPKRTTAQNTYEVKLCKTIFAYLETAYLFYQSAHWQTAGSTFYADHLLFQRLYEGVREEIDSLGEKIVGVFNASDVDYTLRLKHLCTLSDYLDMNANQKAYINTALAIETKLLEHLKSTDTMDYSPGVKDLFAGFANAHEGHVYLLKQRQRG
jgi:DNA-binding ferritin-like protein